MEQNKPTPVQRAKDFWKGLRRPAQIAVVFVPVMLLALVVYLLSTAGQVEYEVLRTGLLPKDAAQITTILDDLNIPYSVEGVNSVTIRVPKGTRAKVMLELQKEGFPASDTDSYAFYQENATGIGVTEQDKRVYDRFATEQRLAYLIRQMEKVKDVGVMVTPAQTSQFALSNSSQPAQASVVLTLESPDKPLSEAEAEAIRSLVVTAVAGLKPENVTISDTNLRVYAMPGENESQGVLAAQQLALKQQHQELVQKQVYNLLNPVFGVGNVVVSASVELDFDKKSVQSVTYSPPGDADNMGIIVSLQQVAERAGVDSMAEGVAGFDANGAAPFYPETLNEDTAPIYSYSQQLNAEVNEVREQIEQAQGRVVGLSVAIMIDADEGLDDELDNIRALIANALGVEEKYISIMRTSFKVNEDYQKMLEEQQKSETLLADTGDDNQMVIIVAAIVVLVLFILLVVLLRRSRKRRLEYEAELRRLEEERRAREAEEALAEESLRERVGEPDDNVSQNRLKEIQKLASEKPELVAQLLRNWLTDEYR